MQLFGAQSLNAFVNAQLSGSKDDTNQKRFPEDVVKGFFALSIALAVVAAILLARAYALHDAKDGMKFEMERMEMEERMVQEVQAKALLSQAMQGAIGQTREERLLNAAIRVASVAKFYREKNVSVWIGTPAEGEMESMLEESLKTQNARMCTLCIPADIHVNGTPVSLAILDESNGNIFISRNGFAHLPIFLGDSPGMGMTFVRGNHSFITWASEGFS